MNDSPAPDTSTRGLTLGDVLRQGFAALNCSSDSAQLDAELLLADVLQRSRCHLRARPEALIGDAQLDEYRQRIAQRRLGVPVAYLRGRKEFWSLDFVVNRSTLIPRPETESLVEIVLHLLADRDSANVADLGTGSGAIAAAIAHERPEFSVHASDICNQALGVARLNAHRLGLHNIEFALGSWCQPWSGRRFDLIAANPPYIANSDACLTADGLRFEPRQALVGGSDGLRAIRQLAAQARSCLSPGGWLVLEHGLGQAPSIAHLLAGYGYREITHHRDWSGHTRVAVGRYRHSSGPATSRLHAGSGREWT